jgi:hypothetical protein
MEGDAFESSHSERGEAVMQLQVCESTLDGGAPTVEAAPAFGVPGDARQEPSADPDRQDWLLAFEAAQGDDGLAVALLALAVDPLVVVALVRRARLGPVAASVERVEERGDEVGLLPSPEATGAIEDAASGRAARPGGTRPFR